MNSTYVLKDTENENQTNTNYQYYPPKDDPQFIIELISTLISNEKIRSTDKNNLSLLKEKLLGILDLEESKFSAITKQMGMEQALIDTYWALRENNFLGISKAADELENILNKVLDLPAKYCGYCLVPHDVVGAFPPQIRRIHAKQNENFMEESRNIFTKHLNESDIVAYHLPENFFGISGKNWDEDPEIQKFQVQLILEDLIDQKKLKQCNAGQLLNPKQLADNKQNLPFIYAALKLNMALNQISKTHKDEMRVALKNTVAELNDNSDYPEPADKCLELQKAILATSQSARDNAYENKSWLCFFSSLCNQSNLANALETFNNKVMEPIINSFHKEEEQIYPRDTREEVDEESVLLPRIK